MTCIEKIYSVSALVGGATCNANCSFCAGKYLREEASYATADKIKTLAFERNLESAIKLCAKYGGWSLSLTSSGEPTCSPSDVTKALQIYDKCANQGAYLPNVNLFSNGIDLGNDQFCDKWLPIWKKYGLTNVCVSIHSHIEATQAEVYNVKEYPKFNTIFENIKKYGIGVRCTLLLNKNHVGNVLDYKSAVDYLIYLGVKNITSWPVGNPDGSRNEFTPSWYNMLLIKHWLYKNTKLCHGHSWGGGVYDYKGSILRLTDYVTKHDPNKDFVRQLVVFQDGLVTYSWIRPGALCMR